MYNRIHNHKRKLKAIKDSMNHDPDALAELMQIDKSVTWERAKSYLRILSGCLQPSDLFYFYGQLYSYECETKNCIGLYGPFHPKTEQPLPSARYLSALKASLHLDSMAHTRILVEQAIGDIDQNVSGWVYEADEYETWIETLDKHIDEWAFQYEFLTGESLRG